jgi:hypothetical protein
MQELRKTEGFFQRLFITGRPGIVVHICNPSYAGGGDRRNMVQSQSLTKM